jgi:hypothetical protein
MRGGIVAIALASFVVAAQAQAPDSHRPAPSAKANTVAPKQSAPPASMQDALNAFRLSLMAHWAPPRGSSEAVVVRVKLKEDGTLAAPPMVLTSAEGKSPQFGAIRDSALRAIITSQPFTMLPRDKYEVWKDIEIKLDPTQIR